MSLHHGTEEAQWYTEKICPRHWERLAVVYVRQSTMQRRCLKGVDVLFSTNVSEADPPQQFPAACKSQHS